MFASAKQAEIIRSNQKDDYYSSYVKSSLVDIVQSFFGARTWLRWRHELHLAADIFYLGLTTLAGYQTLGEEYVNIVQVDSTLRAIPSGWRRAFMILLQVTTPYLIDRSLSYLEKQLRINPDISLTPDAKTTLLTAIPVIRHMITILHRCHLALFYMRGFFYHFSKRFTSIHYILVRDIGGESSGSSYRILGWLSLVQLMVTFLQHLYRWSLRQRQKYQQNTQTAKVLAEKSSSKQLPFGVQDSSDATFDPSLKCVLCLEKRSRSTSTPCGHLFCWSCITEWCSNKPECPLCRDTFEISRLICLQNYDPT